MPILGLGKAVSTPGHSTSASSAVGGANSAFTSAFNTAQKKLQLLFSKRPGVQDRGDGNTSGVGRLKTIESDEPGHSFHSEEEEKGEFDERRSSTGLSSLKLGSTYEERKSNTVISDRLGKHSGDTGIVSNRTYSH